MDFLWLVLIECNDPQTADGCPGGNGYDYLPGSHIIDVDIEIRRRSPGKRWSAQLCVIGVFARVTEGCIGR